MRERHEPARMADDEDPPLGTAASARRFARLVPSPATRREAPGRLGLTVLAGTVVLILALAAIVSGARALVHWLHGRPAYQLRFDGITLEPGPPAWFVRGRAGFLDGLRANAKRPESLSVLDVDLATLRDDFRHYAWVKKVIGVERLVSNRIVVRLDYREPVARWEGDPKVIIDRDGVILPGEDIMHEAAQRLIWLASVDQPPFDAKPGEPWKKGDAAEGLARPDERVLAAARLADFLKVKRADAPIPALRVSKIHPMTERKRGDAAEGQARPFDRVWLSIEFDDQLIVLWGDPPGGERPGEPSASKKWDMLREHVRDHETLSVPDPTKTYWKLTEDGLVERPRPGN